MENNYLRGRNKMENSFTLVSSDILAASLVARRSGFNSLFANEASCIICIK